ncbi:hypothetical protein D6851_14540 [Altericroceibacterium spongiae]|uniref:Nicotinamide riboside transporter PnuC n=1 Tax=Altericroceibacterium spongiae TaxID=2320269 RepID=A0A420ECF3_9SPHN|nr:hypothetical protein [Altericroceibacterium spongiae]RKF18356.1 hypothetical protein D6851_14540 [Altericroceibacterium spongiae]
MNGPLEWFAAIGTILSAGMIAVDWGRKWTGWAFVLFVAVSIAWIVSGLLNDTIPLAVQNGLLLGVNLWGVWQYLLSPKNRKKIERMEELEEKASEDIEAGRD